MSELPMSAEERLAALERKVNLMWNAGGDSLGTDGVMIFGPSGAGVTRLSSAGMDVVAYDSGDEFAAVPKGTRIRWYRDEFGGDEIGEVSAGYSTPGVVDFSHAVLRSFSDGFDSSSGKLGVFNLAGGYWETLLTTQNTDALQPFVVLKRIGSSLTQILAVSRTDDDNYRVSVRQGGTLVDLSTGGGGMTVKVKEADETVTTNTTLQDDDEIWFAVAANEVWQFEGWLFLNAPTAADFKMTFTGPSGAVGSFFAEYRTTATTTFLQAVGNLATSTSFAPAQAGIALYFHGGIHNGANAGNLQLQWAQDTSSGSTIVEAGSYIKYQQANV